MICELLEQRVKSSRAHLVFADAHDERVLSALETLSQESALLLTALISRDTAERIIGRPLSKTIMFDDGLAHQHNVQQFLVSKRSAKGLTDAMAYELSSNPLFIAGWMVHTGRADAAVAGSISTTSDVIRAALWTVGLSSGVQTLSSYFLMDWPDRYFLFSDCGVVPDPSVDQLVDIAHASVTSLHALTNDEPRIAFVSFSTHGSAQHPLVDKVRSATALFSKKHPNIKADGELQIDAAIVPSVASRKAPDSLVAGNANILVFPDLNAGNSAYKIAERLGGATALGPILQGLAKPYCDLSRGCIPDDIVHVARIAALMAAVPSWTEPATT
ncbi:MAG: phosphotransacetylase [Ignavibacteria bacterium]|nr:phosphotransacetylase [Ignavibacteria bacterium]